MKLANDALLAIVGTFRKGLIENIDISDLLRKLDLVPDAEGKLKLSPQQEDVWSTTE
jgi:hypothetical protein